MDSARRWLLFSAMVAPIPAAIGFSGPMMEMVAERNRIADWINAQPCWGAEREQEREAVHQRHWDIENRVFEAEPATIDALKAQFALLLKLDEEGAEIDYATVTRIARGGLKLLRGA